MTDSENREITRLAIAVEAQGRELAEVRGDVKAIVQWTRDRAKVCDRHEGDIDALERALGDQRDRITAGLTRQAMVAGLISALIVGLAVGVPLWIRIAAAAPGKGG